jgi:hypothetical protein
MVIMRRSIAFLGALTLVVAACTEDTAPTTSISEAAATTTSTTIPATTTITAEEPGLAPPDPFATTTDGAAGSGCEPGSDSLPTGYWFGSVLEAHETTIEFDLACFYTGDIAWEKAAEEGEEANNNFWIVNENPELRTVDIAPGATIWVITEDVSASPDPVPVSDWDPEESPYTPCPGEGCAVWLEITNGVVTEIVEQYLP